MGLNSSELVQYLMLNLQIFGIMAIAIFLSLLTYHKHNFFTPAWPNSSQSIENGKPGSGLKQPDILSDSVWCSYYGPYP
jgi:hypothetical protein